MIISGVSFKLLKEREDQWLCIGLHLDDCDSHSISHATITQPQSKLNYLMIVVVLQIFYSSWNEFDFNASNKVELFVYIRGFGKKEFNKILKEKN